jgi:hypothetical protein
MQGVEARTAADILPSHLPDYNFGIGINVEFLGFPLDGILQGFHQSGILGNVIVLAPDPFRDPDGTFRQTADYYANARRTRVSQASAVHIGHQF